MLESVEQPIFSVATCCPFFWLRFRSLRLVFPTDEWLPDCAGLVEMALVEVLGMTTKEARESILEIQVNDALSGHDLGPFEPAESFEGSGYEARCRKCNQSAWVRDSGLMYSLLDERCSGAK